MWWLGLGGLLLGAGLLALGLWHWAEGEHAFEQAIKYEERCRLERVRLRAMVVLGTSPGGEDRAYLRITPEVMDFLSSTEPTGAATVRDYDGGVR